MWYDQTKGMPDAVVSKAMFEVGPGYDRDGVAMEDRAVVLWDEKDSKNPTHESGYLFMAPAAGRHVRLDPLVIPIKGRSVPYAVKMMGYIGEPGGYSPPGYERTPLPNRLFAYKLTPLNPPEQTTPPGDLIVKPLIPG